MASVIKKAFADLGIVRDKTGQYLAPINRIWYDYTRNLRIDYSDCLPNPEWNEQEDADVSKLSGEKFNAGLYEDVRMHGILVPLDVSFLEGAELASAHKKAIACGVPSKDAKMIALRGIRGHRRMKTLMALHALYPNDPRYAMIPVNIHEGLTYQQEMDLLVDQFGIKQLNACEIVNAIRVLRLNGLKEFEIAARINKSRGFVQRRLWIIGFPSFVFDAWVAYMLKKTDVNPRIDLTDERLNKLNMAATSDRKAGRKLDDVHSDFMKQWNAYVNPVDANGNPVAPPARERKTLSKDEIIKFADDATLDSIIRSTLDYVIKRGDVSLHTLNAECMTLRKKAAAYDDMSKPAPKATPKKTGSK